jgi:hypothetical protein
MANIRAAAAFWSLIGKRPQGAVFEGRRSHEQRMDAVHISEKSVIGSISS